MADFFIDHLPASLFEDGADDLTRLPRRFFSRDVLDHVDAIRASFRTSGRIPHVALRPTLDPAFALRLHEGLEAAPFAPHHHTAYRIDIARPASLRGPLRTFTRWLGTDAAAAFHGWLVDFPVRLHARQVQVARARQGDAFPMHVDMHDHGLAAVYNFTLGYRAGAGGLLRFEGPAAPVLEPRFNTLLLFMPRGAPHEVTRIERRGLRRYTVTAFFKPGTEG